MYAQRPSIYCTSDSLALGQDGDGSLCHLLLVHNRRDLGAPAVRTHPDEMTCLVSLFSSMEQSPAKGEETDVAMDKVGIPTSPTLILFCNSLHTSLAELDWNDCVQTRLCAFCCGGVFFRIFKLLSRTPYLISSSLAKIMTTLAFGFSLSRRMTLSNSPCLGSRGILTDWEMHTPPEHTEVYSCQIVIGGKCKSHHRGRAAKHTVYIQKWHCTDYILWIESEYNFIFFSKNTTGVIFLSFPMLPDFQHLTIKTQCCVFRSSFSISAEHLCGVVVWISMPECLNQAQGMYVEDLLLYKCREGM